MYVVKLPKFISDHPSWSNFWKHNKDNNYRTGGLLVESINCSLEEYNSVFNVVAWSVTFNNELDYIKFLLKWS